MKNIIEIVYRWMFGKYGYQGWWPVLECKNKIFKNKVSSRGYHHGDYSYPKNCTQRFEICIGAILTQNTAWTNVEKALSNLHSENLFSAEELLSIDVSRLKELIRPAGYFNQKSKYLINFAELYISLNGKSPGRNLILSCKGIGNETADSILLYAYSHPEFVVDAYTKRIFSNLGIIDFKDKYMTVKNHFESNLKQDVSLYQEYHALIVEHAKRYYQKKPYGIDDPMLKKLNMY